MNSDEDSDQNLRKAVPTWLKAELDFFYGPDSCICGCDGFRQYHHLNDMPWESGRFENLLPVDPDINWAAHLANIGNLSAHVDYQEQKIRAGEIAARGFKMSRFAYPHSFGCNRILAYFAACRSNREVEFYYFAMCLRNLNRISDSRRVFEARHFLIQDVLKNGLRLFSHKDITDSTRADFLDSVASTCHDCDQMMVGKGHERISILQNKAAVLRKKYTRENPRSTARTHVAKEFAFHLRRHGHTEAPISSGRALRKSVDQVNESIRLFENLKDDEGRANALFSKALTYASRLGNPKKAFEALEQLPGIKFQNPWNAASSLALESNLLRKFARGTKMKKKADEVATHALIFFRDWNFPLPPVHFNEAANLMLPVVQSTSSKYFLPIIIPNSKLPPSVLSFVDKIIRML